MVLKEEHIAVFIANWDDKAANLRKIQARLNIGFDSMVFLDDSPFERNLVRELIPEILVPELPEDPAQYVRFLSELNLFETSTHSGLDGQRNLRYQEQDRREGARAQGQDLDAYLAGLDTEADISPFLPGNLSRIVQLIQRSNQFNLTTRRHSEAECRKFMEPASPRAAFSIHLRDRFGDFGLIGVVMLERHGATLEIDTFLMSCRVLQRGVEQLAMNHIFALAREQGASQVAGLYLPTGKNALVEGFYPQFGFTPAAAPQAGAARWIMDVASFAPREVHIRPHILHAKPDEAL
jgi:FkbH-like protein